MKTLSLKNAHWPKLSRLGIFSLLLLASILSGCATGKGAFERGDYTRAVELSSKRLSNHPNSPKAEMVLVGAYPQARADWLAEARAARDDLYDSFRWERVFRAYRKINDMVAQASRAQAAYDANLDLTYFHEEEHEARRNAAEARRIAGDELLSLEERFAAREAYHHYGVSLSFVPNQQDVVRNRAVAKEIGTLRVGIEPVSARRFGVDGNELEQLLLSKVSRYPVNEFVEFVPSYLAEDRAAHEYLKLTVLDVDIAREYVDTIETEYTKEVVVGKTKGEQPKDIVRPVYAQVFKLRKEVRSSGSLDLSIYSMENDSVVVSRRLSEDVAWEQSWYRVFGDERALPHEFPNEEEPLSPSFQEQAYDLTRVLADDVYAQLCSYYASK